jgi:hypothetical protein
MNKRLFITIYKNTMKNKISEIKEKIKTINPDGKYSTGFIVENMFFSLEKENKTQIRGHIYYLIYSGFIKAKQKTPIGASKKKIFEIKGSDIIQALKHYYNL